MENDFEVVVVGGGPVGLWLACELALAKVKVMVLERRAERVAQSRALAIHGRTLEVFALRGLADRFLSRAVRSRPAISARSTRRSTSRCSTHAFPFSTSCLRQRPRGCSKSERWNSAWTSGAAILLRQLEQQRDRVLVKGRNGEALFALSAPYIVGADGARSIVRRAAAIDFRGHPARHTMMLGDVVLDSPPVRPMVTIVNEAGGMLVVQLGDGVHHRIVVVDVPTSPVATPSLFRSLTSRPLRPASPTWTFVRAIRSGCRASRMKRDSPNATERDRILLAGDAAHIHSPMGGQGMNVGIQDAMNLGWKLASVVRVRRPRRCSTPMNGNVGRSVRYCAAIHSRSSRCSPTFDAATLALRGTLEEILRVPEVNRQLADEVSGFGVSLSGAALPAGPGLGTSQRREWAASPRHGPRLEGQFAHDTLPPA